MEKIIKTLKPNKADRDINIKKPKIEERKLNKELSERISMLEMQSVPALAGIDDNMQNVDATLLDEITEDYKPTKK